MNKQRVRYTTAVVLVVTSIVLAYVQVLTIDTIASGTLLYIAQALLFAASVFGLDYYVSIIANVANTRNTQQQPSEH